MTKPKSYHDGANDERTATLAKLRRLRKLSPCCVHLERLEVYLLTRVPRNKERKGGL